MALTGSCDEVYFGPRPYKSWEERVAERAEAAGMVFERMSGKVVGDTTE